MEEYRVNPTIAYDVVELPSKGIYYDNKKKSVKVSYLTASDENILSAQNFVQGNGVIDELLKRKILDKDINTEDLVDEDRQAILIFLRNTAFGSQYTISSIDPKTGKEFDFIIDLGTLKMKDFTLVEDSNGEYSYFMEKANADITFKFLTKKQELEIEKIEQNWNGSGVPPVKTKELEFMVKSVKGNRDPLNIKNFVENLPILDSQNFRKYVKNNRPGIDLTTTTKTPSGEDIQINIGFGVEFFRPFYGV
jgi:hypothetical protein